MKFDLRRPCAECPFRPDRPGFLCRARAEEIAGALRMGATFTCHKTLARRKANRQHCAGARLTLLHDGYPEPQLAQVGERLGALTVAPLDPEAPAFDSLRAFVDHHTA
jgi:hypothetical protein